jgi:hypothetical protein
MSNPLLRKRKVSEKILELPDEAGHPVPYHVREMGATEKDRLEEILADWRKASGKEDSIEGLRALLVCFTACDASGKRYFDEATDLPALQDAPFSLVGPLALNAANINGVAAGQEREAVKN